MTTNVTPGVLPVDDARYGKGVTRLSWGAIFAGVVLAVAVQLVLGILGTGIGLTMVDPVEGTTPGAAASASVPGSTGSSPPSSRLAQAAMRRRASPACMTGSTVWFTVWSSGA